MQTSQEIAQKLRVLYEQLKDQSPYEIFELWPGCGRKLVQTRFYELVKSHHPDSYGGNLSSEIRNMAQENFIRIKEAYNMLLSIEDDQTAASPDEADQSASDGLSINSLSEASVVESAPSRGPGYFEQSAASKPEVTPKPVATSTPEIAKPDPKPSPSSLNTPDEQSKVPLTLDRTAALARLKSTKRSAASYGLDAFSDVIEPVSLSNRHSLENISQPIQERQPDADRRALLDKLANKRKAPPAHIRSTPSSSSNPSSQIVHHQINFNEGYKLFKAGKPEEALPLFKKAHEADLENGLYLTFYGQSLYLTHPDKAADAEELLRNAILTKNRQSLPDAHLFLGLLLKSKEGGIDEAIRHFRNTLYLNPSSREAQREIRLFEMRHSEGGEDGDGFLKKLFKK